MSSGERARTVVRKASARDLDALVELLGVLFRIETDFVPHAVRQRRALSAMLKEPRRCVVLVAETAGEVVGMVTGQLVMSTAQGGPSVWLEDMVVRDSVRRRGVARRLLASLLAWTEAAGAQRVQLLADVTNVAAHRFYRAMDWHETQLVCWRYEATPKTRSLPPRPRG